MSVSDQLKAAWAEVQAAGLPEHVQSAALVEALRMGSETAPPGAATGAAERSTPARKQKRGSSKSTGSEAAAEESDADSDPVDDDAFFEAIERETGLSPDILETILFLDGGAPRVNVTKRMLGDTLKKSQVNASVLVIAARHFGLGEAEVDGADVVAECKRLGIFDRNLASNLKGLPGIVQTGGRTKVYKVRRAGIDTFSAAVSAVTGGEAASEA